MLAIKISELDSQDSSLLKLCHFFLVRKIVGLIPWRLLYFSDNFSQVQQWEQKKTIPLFPGVCNTWCIPTGREPWRRENIKPQGQINESNLFWIWYLLYHYTKPRHTHLLPSTLPSSLSKVTMKFSSLENHSLQNVFFSFYFTQATQVYSSLSQG